MISNFVAKILELLKNPRDWYYDDNGYVCYQYDRRIRLYIGGKSIIYRNYLMRHIIKNKYTDTLDTFVVNFSKEERNLLTKKVKEILPNLVVRGSSASIDLDTIDSIGKFP